MLIACICGWRGTSLGGLRRHKRACTVDDPQQRSRDDHAALERVRAAADTNDRAKEDA